MLADLLNRLEALWNPLSDMDLDLSDDDLD
jgi:hypothetical protein